MAIQIEPIMARYHGQRVKSARVVVGGQTFDLGLADTVRAIDMAAAKDLLRNLYDRAGAEPRGVDEFLEEATELVAACKSYSGWQEPVKRDRTFGKRRFPQSTSWRTI